MATIEPRRRLLPPPTKPKRKGHEPSTPTSDEIPTPTARPKRAVADLREQQDGHDAPPKASPRRPVTMPPQAAADQDTAVRTTVYSDARIEHYLDEVRVHAAVARLDLTQSAVWRWAIGRLMETHTPPQVVEHFLAEPLRGEARVGRPRR